jgi:hypothetical protein
LICTTCNLLSYLGKSFYSFVNARRAGPFYPQDWQLYAARETVTVSLLLIPLPNELMLLSVVAAAGGLCLFIRGFRLLARKRLLVNTPTSKIRSASLGLVEVSGVAMGPYNLPAPITGSPCYLYRTIAWRQAEESKTQEWKKVAEETLHVFFFLEDGTGQLLVNPAAAELDLHCDFRQSYDQTWISRMPEHVAAFLDRHGVTPRGDHFRIEEWTIRPNQNLYIVGTIAENAGVASQLPRAADARQFAVASAGFPAPEVVRLSGSATSSISANATQQAKIAAALHKAGITSPAAWESAGVADRDVTVEEPPVVTAPALAKDKSPSPEEGSRFDLSSPIMLMKGENNPTFLISWRSQRELIRSLSWKSALMIWCGAGLTLLGIYMLLAQLELL